MHHLPISVSPEKFDAAVGGGPGLPPVLPEGGDPAIYIKPRGTEGGHAAVVICFSVKLPDGTIATAQTTTCASLLEGAGMAIAGWRRAGII